MICDSRTPGLGPRGPGGARNPVYRGAALPAGPRGAVLSVVFRVILSHMPGTSGLERSEHRTGSLTIQRPSTLPFRMFCKHVTPRGETGEGIHHDSKWLSTVQVMNEGRTEALSLTVHISTAVLRGRSGCLVPKSTAWRP